MPTIPSKRLITASQNYLRISTSLAKLKMVMDSDLPLLVDDPTQHKAIEGNLYIAICACEELTVAFRAISDSLQDEGGTSPKPVDRFRRRSFTFAK